MLVLAACGVPATPAVDGPATPASRDATSTTPPLAEGNAPSATEVAPFSLPAWLNGPFTEVTSGRTLTAADFEGKVVLVETMAIWCTTCRAQQREVRALHEALGPREDLVSLVLDVDPNENAEALRAYVAQQGFVGLYAVAPAEVAAALASEYGPSLLNPPSAPMLIVGRDGAVQLLPFGVKSMDVLERALEPHL
jgi:thiol-disulfide isomerase/thioredoxin